MKTTEVKDHQSISYAASTIASSRGDKQGQGAQMFKVNVFARVALATLAGLVASQVNATVLLGSTITAQLTGRDVVTQFSTSPKTVTSSGATFYGAFSAFTTYAYVHDHEISIEFNRTNSVTEMVADNLVNFIFNSQDGLFQPTGTIRQTSCVGSCGLQAFPIVTSTDPHQLTVSFRDVAGGTGFAIGLQAVTASVPEPVTWATMILGLGAVGYAMRRRPKVMTRGSSAG